MVYQGVMNTPTIIEGRSDAAIADGGIIVSVLMHTLLLFKVVQYGKHFARLDISVVKKELCFSFQWVPIKHGALLGIPCVCFV